MSTAWVSSLRAEEAPHSQSGAPVAVRWEEFLGPRPARARVKSTAFSPQRGLALYRALRKVQVLDRAILNLSMQGRVGLYTPVCGQEAAQVGVAAALAEDDWMVPTFRDFGTQLCRGESLETLLLFLLGFEEGSMEQPRNLPLAAPVASQIPHAVGIAWQMRQQGESSVVVVSMGDGATSKGDFHEALNMAAVMQLPVMFWVQNNAWALSTSTAEQTRTPTIAEKAIAYGVRGVRVDGESVWSTHVVAREVIASLRRGEGPVLLETTMLRRGPHGTSDDPRLYRDDVEPLDVGATLRMRLEACGWWGVENEVALTEEVRAELDRSLAKARSRARTLRSDLNSAFQHVYASPPAELQDQAAQAKAGLLVDPAPPRSSAPVRPPRVSQGEKLTLVESLRLALQEEMGRDDTVVLWGEDIAKLGGVFRVTQGLLDDFGPQRVVDTPIAESGMMGAVTGVALAGGRPVLEIQFGGFIYSAVDQMRSHTSRFRARTRGRLSVPLVVRAPYGAGIGAPESHSDSVEMLGVRTPGIKVVVPSSPRRGRALLKSAIRDPDPVLFLEPIAIYRTVREKVPHEEELFPLGRASILRHGQDVTLVSYGAMIRPTLTAAQRLSRQGIRAEVIDLMTLSPLDVATIAASVSTTGALVVVHEGARSGDMGGEILARLRGLGDIKFARLCSWDIPLPFHGRERAVIPTPSQIEDAVARLLKT